MREQRVRQSEGTASEAERGHSAERKHSNQHGRHLPFTTFFSRLGATPTGAQAMHVDLADCSQIDMLGVRYTPVNI